MIVPMISLSVIIINIIAMWHKKNNAIVLISILWILVLMGLNTFNSDFVAYEGYYVTQTYDFSVEPVYKIFSRIVYLCNVPYNGFLCIYFLTTLLICIYVLRQMNGSLHCFFALYMLTALYLNACEIRQTMAYCLYPLVILFISKGKRYKALITLLLGVGFQKSSLLLLPIVFLNRKILDYRKLLIGYSVLLIFFCGIIFLNGNEIPGLRALMSLFLPEDKLVYFESKTRLGFLVFWTANFLNLWMLFYFSKINRKENTLSSRFVNDALNAALYLNVAMPLCMINSEFLRYFRFTVLPVLFAFSNEISKYQGEAKILDQFAICKKKKLTILMIIYVVVYTAVFQHFRVVSEILTNNMILGR